DKEMRQGERFVIAGYYFGGDQGTGTLFMNRCGEIYERTEFNRMSYQVLLDRARCFLDLNDFGRVTEGVRLPPNAKIPKEGPIEMMSPVNGKRMSCYFKLENSRENDLKQCEDVAQIAGASPLTNEQRTTDNPCRHETDLAVRRRARAARATASFLL